MEPARLREVYRECMRNHAARLGGHACDGCCEYTPDVLNPHMVFCTACGCHRNFHRRVVLSNNAAANIRMLMGVDPFRLRRRRRTKFSAEQKARMEAFAARIAGRSGRKRRAGRTRCRGSAGRSGSPATSLRSGSTTTRVELLRSRPPATPLVHLLMLREREREMEGVKERGRSGGVPPWGRKSRVGKSCPFTRLCCMRP